jgi:DNA-binding HxlR family transcriptional regulator
MDCARIARMTTKKKPLSVPERAAYRRLEDVVGCKWSAAVLAAIGRDVTRPGQLERFIPGISTKVLNERLRKLLDYGLIIRREFPGRSLRVEYNLSATGKKLSTIIEQIRDLDEEHTYRTDGKTTGSKNARPSNSCGFMKHL